MTRYDPTKHHRRSIRLKGYDYAQPGAYLVTLVSHERELLFGDVVDGDMVLNECGQIAKDCWEHIPVHFPRALIDAFIIMPNHVHGIVIIRDGGTVVGATHASPRQPRGPARGSLGAIVGSFKSAVSRRINQLRVTPGAPIWQRNYYEHIIRNDRELNAIRRYIHINPTRWAEDRDNPDRTLSPEEAV